MSAENIPEFIWHFASAMFVSKSLWRNSNAITQELQQGYSNSYINTYLSYVKM